MFNRDSIYTVHVNPDREDPSERVILVREGFSFWAFALTLIWTLANRLWLLSALYVVLTALIYKGGDLIGLDESMRGIVQLGLQIWLGTSAHDWQRLALEQRGYEEVSVVCAPSALQAEQRYYDHQPA